MKVKRESEPLSHVRLLATQWTAAHQAPLPMGFSRQEYWSGVPLPSFREFGGGRFGHKCLGYIRFSQKLVGVLG